MKNVAGRWRRILFGLVVAGMTFGFAPGSARGQLGFPDSTAPAAPNPLADSTVPPGKMLLFDLEARFVRDVAARGGAGFASWFADDGVVLSNGKAPVVGQAAIAKSATWDPKAYQLTWTPTDAKMSPSGDMGYAWGHFEARSKDASGHPVTTTGRFITVWQKQPDGHWKVELDAGANEPPKNDCCKLPGAQ
ncbi:MAG: YybH family protein [Terracidiphilus sp.]